MAEPEARHNAWPKLLDENVSTRNERRKRGAVRLTLQIERHAFFAAVEHKKSRALTVDQGRKATGIFTSRLLDFHYLGTGFSEHQRRERAREERGEIQNE